MSITRQPYVALAIFALLLGCANPTQQDQITNVEKSSPDQQATPTWERVDKVSARQWVIRVGGMKYKAASRAVWRFDERLKKDADLAKDVRQLMAKL